jgi:hypothetical protein
MKLPPVMEQSAAQPQFFFGPAGSGAPVHFHGDAWNVVAYGAKRWCVRRRAAGHSCQRLACR